MGFSEQAQLSELHRLAQTKLQTVVAGDVAKAFPLLDAANVDASFGNYFGEMKRVINARRTLSSSLSSTLYEGIRKDAGITSLFTPLLDTAVSDKQLFTSLLVTGPVSIKKSLEAGATLEQAHANALTSTIRASQRHVANGGRETITKSVKRDKAAKGWARLTDSKPCSFCAMLASRGPVYKSEQTSHFRSHDGCGCTAVPVFDLAAPWPGRAEEFRAAYDENISGKFAGGDGNNDAVKAWRKFYDTKLEPTPFNAAKNISEELVAKAKAFEPELTARMNELADRNGGTLEGLDYRVKTSESLTRKIAKDVSSSNGTLSVDDAAAKMFDVNRYTMQIQEENYSKGAQAVIDELRASGNTVKVKNYWLVDDNPYQGINIQVTSKTGQQYELQFHTPKSLEIKEGALHDIYELARKTKDPVKLARFNERSFAAAQSIPVPRGVEGIRSGLGDEVAKVAKVAKAPKVKPAADVPAYRAAWDEAVAKLPADRGQIGRVVAETPVGPVPTAKEMKLAEARIRDEAKFTDDYVKLYNKRTAGYEQSMERQRAIDALKDAYAKAHNIDFSNNFQAALIAERKAAKEALEEMKNRLNGGTYDTIERPMQTSWGTNVPTKAAGEVLDAHLDAVLDAGKALGIELDERIAKRIASAGPADTSATMKAMEVKRAQYLADKEVLEKSKATFENDPEVTKKLRQMYDDSVERSIARQEQPVSFEDFSARYKNMILTRDPKYIRVAKKLEKLTRDFSTELYRAQKLMQEAQVGVIEPGTIAFADIQREETMKLLSELRKMGGQGADYVTAAGKPLVTGDLVEAMDYAHSSYPSDWMKTVRERFPRVELGKLSRGHNGSGIEIKLSEGNRRITGDKGYNAVAVHELGHSMQEAIPGLKQLDFAYRSRRGTIVTEAGEKITERTKWIGSGTRDEVAIHDSWRTPYSGKVYGENNSPEQLAEVFTTGAESLLSGSPWMNKVPNSLSNPDPARLLFDTEFRDYVLGVLSVL